MSELGVILLCFYFLLFWKSFTCIISSYIIVRNKSAAINNSRGKWENNAGGGAHGLSGASRVVSARRAMHLPAASSVLRPKNKPNAAPMNF